MNKSERHSSELKSTEHIADGFFEFGGHRLPVIGTSGPPMEQSRMAEGKPIRAGLPDREQSLQPASELFEFGGSKLQLSGTSGPAKELPRTAEGMPVRRDAVSRESFSKAGSTGSGHLTAGPVRRG